MVSGYTYLPNDTEFSLIEAASQKKPGVWTETVMNEKGKCPKFDSSEVMNSNFVTNTVLEQSMQYRNKDTEETCFSWMDISCLRVMRYSTLMLLFKETSNDEQAHTNCVL